LSDWLAAVKWDAQGLVPAIAQDAASGEILMVAWMNREALEETARTGTRRLFFTLAQQAVAQGRRIRPCAERQRNSLSIATMMWCC